MIRELLEVALWLGLAVVIAAAALGPLLGWYFK